MSAHEELRKKLCLWPIRAPRIPELMELLKTLYSEDEAELLVKVFTAPYQDAVTSEEAAERARAPVEEVRRKLDKLASRGLVMRFRHWRDGSIRYSMLPLVPGVFEFYFSGELSEDERRKLAELFEKIYRKGLAMEIAASNYPSTRVLPAVGAVEVGERIEFEHEVLPFEKAAELIKTSYKIALMKCSCRVKNPCRHPVETCLVFDSSADFMVERGYARYLTPEEAIEVLKKAEEAGLVHITTNTQRRPQFICSCCTCSCLILRALTEMGNPRAFAKSNFIAERDHSKCILCGRCIEVCPFKAHFHHYAHDGEEDRVELIPEKCVGCGLCVHHCPTGALKLVKVRNEVPEEKPRDAWLRFEMERVH
ncbi:MAG: hypothetical protein DRN99_04605 [Thermoproteota archaeon]|nr:MAG: hypothetical protein DRN99_04605 [Candidatus Korarchaeota archaeon]